MKLEEFRGLYEQFRQLENCRSRDDDLKRIYLQIEEGLREAMTPDQARGFIGAYRIGMEAARSEDIQIVNLTLGRFSGLFSR